MILLHRPGWLHTHSKPPASTSECWDDVCVHHIARLWNMFLMHWFIKQLAEFLMILCVLEGDQMTNSVSAPLKNANI